MHYETNSLGEGGRPLREVRARPAFVAAGVATTLILHAGLVGLVVWNAMGEAAEPDREPEQKIEFEDVKLLKMGEQKPDNQLPRISNPAAPTPEQETVTLDQEREERPDREREKTQKETETPPDPEPEPTESEKRNQKMDEILKGVHDENRPTNEVTPEGSEKGVEGGTISDEALANMMGTYQAKLLQKIGEYWQVPQTIPESELKTLFGQASVFVRLSKSGNVVSYRWLNRTTNDQFNGSIDRVLKQFQLSGGGHSLPLPSDPRVKKEVLQQGLRLEEWRFTQRGAR